MGAGLVNARLLKAARVVRKRLTKTVSLKSGQITFFLVDQGPTCRPRPNRRHARQHDQASRTLLDSGRLTPCGLCRRPISDPVILNAACLLMGTWTDVAHRLDHCSLP
jgi:hypothetical protein